MEFAPHLTLLHETPEHTIYRCTCGASETTPRGQRGPSHEMCLHEAHRQNKGLDPRIESYTPLFHDVSTFPSGFSATVQYVKLWCDRDGQLQWTPAYHHEELGDGWQVHVTVDADAEQKVTASISDGHGYVADDSLADVLGFAFGRVRGLRPMLRVIGHPETEALFVGLDRAYERLRGERNAQHELVVLNESWPGIISLWRAGFSFAAIGNVAESALQQTQGPLHRRLGVSRFFVPFVRDGIATANEIARISRFAHEELGLSTPQLHGSAAWEHADVLRQVTPDFASWAEPMLTLVHRYRYDAARLVDFARVTMRDYQGIVDPAAALSLLVTYHQLIDELEDEAHRYPDSIKRSIDLATMRLMQTHNDKTEAQWAQRIASDDYQQYVDEIAEYVIKVPATVQELHHEGAVLSHCVAAYTQQIIDGYQGQRVYLLRHREAPDRPLATLNLRHGRLWQARTFANHPLSPELRSVIREWAARHQLEIGPNILEDDDEQR